MAIGYDDFAGIKFNPFVVPGGVFMWDYYPDLKTRKDLCRVPDFSRLPEFKDYNYIVDSRDLDKMLRFIVLFATNRNSPLRYETDWNKRKSIIYDLLHMHPDDAIRREFIEGSHRWYNTVLGVFFRLIGDSDMEIWFSLKMQMSQILTMLRANPFDSDDFEANMRVRMTAQKILPEMNEQIKAFEGRLFPSQESMSATAAEFMLESDGPGGFAEYYAKDYKLDNQ